MYKKKVTEWKERIENTHRFVNNFSFAHIKCGSYSEIPWRFRDTSAPSWWAEAKPPADGRRKSWVCVTATLNWAVSPWRGRTGEDSGRAKVEQVISRTQWLICHGDEPAENCRRINPGAAAWQWSIPATLKSTDAELFTHHKDLQPPTATISKVPMSKSTWVPITTSDLSPTFTLFLFWKGQQKWILRASVEEDKWGKTLTQEFLM